MGYSCLGNTEHHLLLSINLGQQYERSVCREMGIAFQTLCLDVMKYMRTASFNQVSLLLL